MSIFALLSLLLPILSSLYFCFFFIFLLSLSLSSFDYLSFVASSFVLPRSLSVSLSLSLCQQKLSVQAASFSGRKRTKRLPLLDGCASQTRACAVSTIPQRIPA